jgi:hypothetical protein
VQVHCRCACAADTPPRTARHSIHYLATTSAGSTASFTFALLLNCEPWWLTTAVINIMEPPVPLPAPACKYGDIQLHGANMFQMDVVPGALSVVPLPAPAALPDGSSGTVTVAVRDEFVVTKVIVTLVNFRHPFASDVQARAAQLLQRSMHR